MCGTDIAYGATACAEAEEEEGGGKGGGGEGEEAAGGRGGEEEEAGAREGGGESVPKIERISPLAVPWEVRSAISYAMSGTGLEHAWCYGVCATDAVYGATEHFVPLSILDWPRVLRYGACGPDAAYGATRYQRFALVLAP
eukprot:412447-Rhodomonas_salina.3